MSITDEIAHLFAARGQAFYGENVTEEAHALQSAFFARQAGEDDAMVVACLLHDVGHLIHDMGEDIADHGVDAHHEEVGDPWLRARFPEIISEPARLHVAAKRYLCATRPEYLAALSDASRLSLGLQGGPMSEDEVADFESNAFFERAVRLRYFDDEAKVPELSVPGLEAYRELIEAVAKPAI